MSPAKIWIFACIYFPAQSLFSSSPASFLQIGSGPRAQSLGGAISSDRDGFSAFSRDPALISFLRDPFLDMAGGIRPGGTKLVQMGFAKNIRGMAFGLNVMDLIHTDQILTDESGNTLGSFGNRDQAVTLALGRGQGKAGFGISTTLVRKKLADLSSLGLAVGAGILYPFNSRISLGLCVTDFTLMGIGLESTKEDFSTRIKGGICCKLMDFDSLSLEVLTDLAVSREDGADLGFGSEICLNQVLALRCGLSSESQGERIGMGLKMKKWSLDLSMQLNPLGSRDFMDLSLGKRF